MTKQEHHAFCGDLAEVMRKHGVVAIVGCWFGERGKGMGVVDISPQNNPELQELVKAFQADMRVNMQKLNPLAVGRETKGVHLDKGEKN